jgi:hypothetical protein
LCTFQQYVYMHGVYYGNLSFLNTYSYRQRKLAKSLKKQFQEGFLDPWDQRENYSWPGGRKMLDHPELIKKLKLFKLI